MSSTHEAAESTPQTSAPTEEPAMVAPMDSHRLALQIMFFTSLVLVCMLPLLTMWWRLSLRERWMRCRLVRWWRGCMARLCRRHVQYDTSDWRTLQELQESSRPSGLYRLYQSHDPRHAPLRLNSWREDVRHSCADQSLIEVKLHQIQPSPTEPLHQSTV